MYWSKNELKEKGIWRKENIRKMKADGKCKAHSGKERTGKWLCAVY